METWIVFLALALVSGVLFTSQQADGVAGFTSITRPWYTEWSLHRVAELVDRGYSQVTSKSDKPFQIRYWLTNYIVLPHKYLADIKRADVRHLSFLHSISDTFFQSYWVPALFDSERWVYVVKKGLNPLLHCVIPWPTLSQVTQLCIDHMPKFFQAELGDCTESKDFPALPTFMGLTQRTAALVIMGEELSENKDFNQKASAYFNGTFTTGLSILMLPLGPLRPIFGRAVAWFQSRRQLKIIDMISPVLQKRIDAREKDPHTATENLDAIEWTLRLLPEWPMNPAEKQPLTRISEELIQNLWASGASPGMAITNMVFQVLVDPSILEALREEAEAAVAKHGWSDKIVNSLVLQDSFIREMNRLRPTFAVGCTRTIMNKPFEFSDGMVLPAGTRIGFPVKPSQIDSKVFEDPLTLEPFRFTELAGGNVRNDEGVNIWAASHADATNLAFGYGNHVCPGRFFGVRVIKIVFTRLILKYDISWSRKEKGLPDPFTIEGINTPNPMQKVTLRRRKSTA